MTCTLSLARQIQDHIHGVAPCTPPAHLWLALYSVEPTYEGGSLVGGVELATEGYERLEVSGQREVNLADFGIETDLTSAVAFGVLDASTDGTLLWSNPIDAPERLADRAAYAADGREAWLDCTLPLSPSES